MLGRMFNTSVHTGLLLLAVALCCSVGCKGKTGAGGAGAGSAPAASAGGGGAGASSAGAGVAPAPAASVVKITVKADGSLVMDGAATTLGAIDTRLAALAAAGDSGEVWYYREDLGRDPHPNAMKVLDLVVKHGVSITMSSKPDFSDYVDGDGESHPRQ
jgi:hypothetical protein